MAEIRGPVDEDVQAIAQALQAYEQHHSQAEVVLYRQNSVAVSVRIIDADFQGISRADRHDLVWDYFAALPDETQSQVTILLLLTPEETENSIANLDFEHPIPSRL